MRRLYVSIVLAALTAVGDAAEDRTLTLADCVRLGLERNPNLKRLALDVALAEENIVQSEAVYDARLSIGGVYEDTELPSSRTPIEGSSRSLLIDGVIERALPKGTTISVDTRLSRFEFPGSRTGIDEIDISAINLSLGQSLLRNAWGRLDEARIDSAEAAFQRARLAYLYERDRLAARIYEAYWNAQAAKKAYEVNQHALARSRELLHECPPGSGLRHRTRSRARANCYASIARRSKTACWTKRMSWRRRHRWPLVKSTC